MVNVTFTQSNEIFDKFCVPKFIYCHRWLCDCNLFPMNLEFEKTYYKRIDNELTAFRILAYTLNDKTHPYVLSFLVQLPNEQPKWIKDFINPKTKIYTSVEEYITSGGAQSVNLRWVSIMQAGIAKCWRGYNDRYFFKNDEFYTIKNGAVCESNGHFCSHLLVSKHGWLVKISKRSLDDYEGEKGVYLNKADAMKVLLKDMPISDFAEDPISIDITILPNTPKYTKVMIVE